MAGRGLSKKSEFANAKHLVDVAGGSGGVAIALCQEHPHLQATIIDLPSVVPIAQEMASEAGLADRISGQVADVLENPLPREFDVATARSFFQVLSEEQCQQAAHNIAAALPSGGTLFIVGFVVDDTRFSPNVAVGMNVMFINTFNDGQSYTESQYRNWLANAGFTDFAIEPFSAGSSLITARKV